MEEADDLGRSEVFAAVYSLKSGPLILLADQFAWAAFSTTALSSVISNHIIPREMPHWEGGEFFKDAFGKDCEWGEFAYKLIAGASWMRCRGFSILSSEI